MSDIGKVVYAPTYVSNKPFPDGFVNIDLVRRETHNAALDAMIVEIIEADKEYVTQIGVQSDEAERYIHMAESLKK